MSEFLDELARALARPMPRSRAVRVLGAALVSAAVPGALTRKALGGTHGAGATSPNCRILLAGGRPEGMDCGPPKNPVLPVCCTFDKKLGFQGVVGDGAGVCSVIVDQNFKSFFGTACCCRPNYKCGTTVRDPCVCKQPCGRHQHCCKEDQVCKSWLDKSSDKPPYPKEEDCLEKCAEGRRCKLSKDCCPAAQECCTTDNGDERCCPPGHVCRQGVVRFGSKGLLVHRCRPKCDPPLVRCNFVCCSPEQRAFRKVPVLLDNNKTKEVTQCVCVPE